MTSFILFGGGGTLFIKEIKSLLLIVSSGTLEKTLNENKKNITFVNKKNLIFFNI